MIFWLKLIKKLALFFTIFLLLFFRGDILFAGIIDKVVAKVNGDIITLSETMVRVQTISARTNEFGEKDQIPPDKKLLRQALNLLIEERLQLQEAKKSGLKVDDSIINKALTDLKINNGITDEQFEKLLANEGRNVEEYKTIVRDQILVSRVSRMHIEKKSVVTDRQLKKYYMKNRKEYWEPSKVRVSHILLIAEENTPQNEIRLKKRTIQDIHAQIRNGKDFAELARNYSEDVSAHTGGDVGFIEKGMMVAEFDDAAFQLQQGEVSDVIRTVYGFHIIKCEKIIKGFTKSFKQVKNEINNHLISQNRQKSYLNWISELKKKAYIEISLFDEIENSLTQGSNQKRKIPNAQEDIFFNEDASRIKDSQRLTNKRKKSKGQKITSSQSDTRGFYQILKKLKYFKKLRDGERISDSEYRKKKKELLDNL